jgi:predicted exporter
MRIFPIALIVIGTLGVAKHLGFIPIGMFHLIGPLLLIALGVALFFRRPRLCGNDWHARNGGGSTNTPQPPQPSSPG